MKRIIYLFILLLILTACNSVKSTQRFISSGNYNEAIDNAVEKLINNKNSRKSENYIYLLKDAFIKANKRDLETVNFLEKQKNPENNETIYNTFLSLKRRQQKIEPLLPLFVNKKEVEFKFKDYDTDLVDYMNKTSEYLYNRATNAISSSVSKQDYRATYSDLNYIEEINPNYKDVRALLEQTHLLGIDFIYLYFTNSSGIALPKRLEDDLLNVDSYGLNNFWTVYQTTKTDGINYDYSLQLDIRNIAVTPEQVREKEIIKEKKVKSGFKYLLDEKGRRVKDSLGKNITVDNYINAQCRFYQFTQFKAGNMAGQVIYHNKLSNQVEQSFPIQSEFVFENIYAKYEGDKRALEESLLDLLEVTVVPFPTNEQMIYNLGEDIKQNLKTIISQNAFRR